MSSHDSRRITEIGAEVATACGVVHGRTLLHDDMGQPAAAVSAWLGIPYAAPPVGPLRWKPPQPHAGWAGVLDVSNFGPDMVQAPNARLRGNGQGEDVLTLSVWAPQGATAGSLPVMVWLHGGGFVGGGASDIRSDGAALARLGVVVVAVNYRTGVFGWLAHPELSRESPDGVSGNWGLMDQLLALQWIREQISGFGGDASRVTLFGVSAGSASISLLLTAPAAAGLFHRAILHSPGAGRPLATLDEAEAAGGELGRLDALRALDAAGVAALTSKLNPAVRGLTTPRVLRPICDGVLLPGQERQALLAGRLHAMPIIVGSNTDEGSLLTASWPVRTVADWQALVQRNFGPAASQALAHYPVAGDADVRAAVAALFGDTQFNAGVRLLARAMAARGVPVWRYLFTRRRPGQQDGPHHGDEVAHAFGNLRASYGDAIDATDRALSASMMRAWAGFARDAEPDAGGELSWPRFDVASDPHRVLGHAAATASHWRASTLDFLDAYYASQGL